MIVGMQSGCKKKCRNIISGEIKMIASVIQTIRVVQIAKGIIGSQSHLFKHLVIYFTKVCTLVSTNHKNCLPIGHEHRATRIGICFYPADHIEVDIHQCIFKRNNRVIRIES